jgi:hypothetical protein
MERLTELECDHPRAEHGDRFGEVGKLEDRLAGEHVRLEPAEQGGEPGGRTRGDHDRARIEARRPVRPLDLEKRRADEARLSAEAGRGCEGLRRLDDEADEAIALATDPLQNRRAVHAGRHRELDSEGAGAPGLVGQLGGGDQQLRRHAADSGAGGAIGPGLDQYGFSPGSLRLAPRVQARGSGSDDRHIDLPNPHAWSASRDRCSAHLDADGQVG